MVRHKHIKALRRAVSEAALWRGTMTGNPDTTALDEFDRFIATAKEALAEVAREHRSKRPAVAVRGNTE